MAHDLRVAVLVSGRGTNLRAIAEYCNSAHSTTRIGIVLCDKPGVPAVAYATDAGIPVRVVDRRDFLTRRAFETELDREIRQADCTLICLAGFMRILSPDFIRLWPDKILNIHPSLLPAFPGLDCHRRVIESGTLFTGCTVHVVREKVDDGPIVAQAVVPVLADDDAWSLADRVLEAEHKLYPAVLGLFAGRRVRIVDGNVQRDGCLRPHSVLFSPAGIEI